MSTYLSVNAWQTYIKLTFNHIFYEMQKRKINTIITTPKSDYDLEAGATCLVVYAS